MNFIGIIPSRYQSTRFPGKPLADICGKSMIQRVYEQARKAMEEVWVATDDERIADAVNGFGGNVVMTSLNHRSGTDRCAEAALKASEITGKVFDVVVNIQGDEPFMQPDQIGLIMECFTDSPSTEIATLIQPILKNEDIFRPDMVKVVLDNEHNAIYFSRSPIPHIFGIDESQWLENYPFYGHVGLYAYRYHILQQLSKLSETLIEKVESLEQLRWLENGFKIKTNITDSDNFGIDTPEDLRQAIEGGIEKYFLKKTF
jgi:3-deoxy-manno-octulosonate cytidylyltransferase (CMP-KDO synthetase)